ncbi:MAG: hypothetical protein JO004_06715 [Methylobacteriaceae bacterium]|nr:hypothetical protein [Methylobacteriaceae bacterium]
MWKGFLGDPSGLSTPQIAMIAGGLALASLVGVKVLDAPSALSRQPAVAAETVTDLERLARTIPAGSARAGAAGPLASGQIDFTSTANNAAKRSIQAACHGERTVSMIAPAGGAPILLSTCSSAKTMRD